MAQRRAKAGHRISRGYAGSAALDSNEATCTSHRDRILAAYIHIMNGEGVTQDFTTLKHYGIQGGTKELTSLDDPLLRLCVEWYNSDPDEDDFFNRVGKGDYLEELLNDRLGEQICFKSLSE